MRVTIKYFAMLKEETNLSEETIETSANNVYDLYLELQKKYSLTLSPDVVKVSKDEVFVDWQTPLRPDDTVVFIPPVAGG
ncbi:MAG: MoaD/ThiS family protein [Candidatus Omnitrophica bacterium]|nr:MoaD/ThiS family protein [Candidatus Omnitrophota bacterium]